MYQMTGGQQQGGWLVGWLAGFPAGVHCKLFVQRTNAVRRR